MPDLFNTNTSNTPQGMGTSDSSDNTNPLDQVAGIASATFAAGVFAGLLLYHFCCGGRGKGGSGDHERPQSNVSGISADGRLEADHKRRVTAV